MKNVNVFLVAIAAILWSCSDKDTTLQPINEAYRTKSIHLKDSVKDCMVEYSPFVVNVPTEEEEIDVQSFCESIEYVPLETRPECLLGTIDKMDADSNLIFVLDRQNGVLCSFYRDGRFNQVYGKAGQEEGAHKSVKDFSLDRSRSVVHVLDRDGGKIVSYDYSGRYLSEVPLYYHYRQFECGEGFWALSCGLLHNDQLPSNDAYRLVIADEKQIPLYRAFAYDEKLPDNLHYESLRSFQKTQSGEIFYNYVPSNTIYEVKAGGHLSARYVINAGPDIDSQVLTDAYIESYMQKQRMFASLFVMNMNYLVGYVFTPTKEVRTLLLDRNSNRFKYGNLFYGDKNSLTNKLLANHFDYALYERTFVNVVQPFDVLKLIEEHKQYGLPLDVGRSEQEMLSRVTEESNPVLMMIKLKPL